MPRLQDAAVLAHLFGSPADPLRWHVHPDVWLVLGLVAAGYAAAVVRRAPDRATPVARWQPWCFAAGLAVVALAAEWPIHDVGERYLLSVHMAQHVAFTLVAPPLLLAGLPAPVLRRIFRAWPGGRLLRALARPLPAALVFNAVIVITHLPGWVALSLRSDGAHFGTHVVLVGSALLMWFPVMNRDPALPRLSQSGRPLYLMAQSIVAAVPGSFLGYAGQPVYRAYAEAPRPFALSAMEDQELAALVMNAGEAAILWGSALVLFWWGQRGGRRIEPLRWPTRTPRPPAPR